MTKSRFISAVLMLGALLAISACTVTSDKSKDGKDKVDIKTPFGSLKVDEGVDPRDTGMPLYAGATPYHKPEGHDSANVNISSEFFGLKVVAGEFTTPDSPDKVRDFYQTSLKTYGKVIECKGAYSEHVDVKKGEDDDKDKPVDCSDVHGDKDDEIELKVGTNHHEHVVAVKPDGTGTRFALVYVNARGKESGS